MGALWWTDPGKRNKTAEFILAFTRVTCPLCSIYSVCSMFAIFELIVPGQAHTNLYFLNMDARGDTLKVKATQHVKCLSLCSPLQGQQSVTIKQHLTF